DRNRSHWSTSKTPSYTKSVSWQHHPPVTLLNITDNSKGYTNLKEIAAKSKLTDTTVSIPITASYYVYDTNKVKSGALEATALINVKYD
ncbi:fimbrial protein, partial [Escherichia coli]|uniref:fimbrial protein n=1 Tax=Escherichia coli TaxID=562 RepID=UPI0023013647|nr:fimbrial protein [Escherichia coli]